MLEFFNTKDARVLVFSGDSVVATTDLPLKRQPKTKYAYFLRLSGMTCARPTAFATHICRSLRFTRDGTD